MPLPDFSNEMSQIEEEKNNPPVETVEENTEPVEQQNLTEEEIFKKQKREKLLNHLAKCRELSAAKRKAQKEEKVKNKKPRGRPKKQETKGLEVGENIIINEAPPVKETFEKGVSGDTPRKELPPPTPKIEQIPKNVITPINIDYDKIINGVHEKYIKSKAERKAKNSPLAQPIPTYTPVPPMFDKVSFERQVREDERNKIRNEVARKKQEQDVLKQRTKDYYSRLPPRSLATGKGWDDYFFN
jgi:hypothetical protein